MHSRIAKILVLGALMLALPLLAHAQTSRVEGMAIQGDYIKDYTGIFTYTSGVSNVGNLVYGELGVATGGVPVDRSVGAVMGDWFEGRMGAWAIHMRQFTPQLGQGDATSNPAPGTPPLASDPNFHTSEQFDIMWGRKFGTFALGLRLNRSFGQVELDNDPVGLGNISELTFDFTQFDPNLARNVLGLGVGVGFEMSPTMNVEANLHWQSRTFEVVDTTGVTVTENDGSTAYQFAARAWWQWQPNVMVVPVVKLYSYDLSTTTGTLGFDNSLAGWQAGVAGNWTIGSNDLFVLGLTFAQNKIEQEVDLFGAGFALGNITETFMPQFFAALETHVNSWLTLRFGANKGVWHSTEFEDEGTPTTLTIHDSPFSMSLGAGVKIGSLQFDAIVNDAFPHNGFNFISGATTSPVFPKVTATYAF